MVDEPDVEDAGSESLRFWIHLEKCYYPCCRYLRSLLGGRKKWPAIDRHDLLLETFSEAFENADQLQSLHVDALRKWLLCVLFRKFKVCCRSYEQRRRGFEKYLKRRGFNPEEPREPEALDPPVDSAVEIFEINTILQKALASLNPAGRRLVAKRYLEGVSNVEIAKQLNITPQAVEYRLRTKLKNLRDYFRNYHPQYMKFFGS